MYRITGAVTGCFLLRIQNTGEPTNDLCLRFVTTHKEEQGACWLSNTPLTPQPLLKVGEYWHNTSWKRWQKISQVSYYFRTTISTSN